MLLENVNIMQAIPYMLLGIVFSTPIIDKTLKKINNIRSFKILEDLVIYAIFLLAILKLVGSTYNPFIYFRF